MDPPGDPYAKQREHIHMLWHNVGKGKHIFGVERIVLISISALLMLMPTMAIRWCAGRQGLLSRKKAIERYAFAKIFFLLVILARLSAAWYAPIFAAIFLADLFLFLSGLVLLKEFWTPPASHRRTLILLAVNFLEFSVAFAVLYAHFNCLVSNGQHITGWSNYLYFSIVTSATVGYGDISPTAGVGRFLVTIHIFAALSFMATTVAYYVGNLGEKRLPIK